MTTRPTLISLLGKSKLDAQTGYRTAKYRFSDGATREVPFFGLGLMDCIKPARLILAGTSGSMWDVFFDHQKFYCREQRLRVESATTAWTASMDEGEEIVVPLKNGEGNFIASPEELDRLEGEGLVVFRYIDNPNGSARDIAGVRNERGNVVGLMPHPEHAVEPGFGPDSPAGPRTGTDGLRIFHSVLSSLVAA